MPTEITGINKEEKIIKRELDNVCIKQLDMPRGFTLKCSKASGNLELNKECALTHVTQYNILEKVQLSFKVEGDDKI